MYEARTLALTCRHSVEVLVLHIKLELSLLRYASLAYLRFATSKYEYANSTSGVSNSVQSTVDDRRRGCVAS